MKKVKRIARKVGGDDDEDEDSQGASGANGPSFKTTLQAASCCSNPRNRQADENVHIDSPSAVVRAISKKPKKSSNVRQSLKPSKVSDYELQDDEDAVPSLRKPLGSQRLRNDVASRLPLRNASEEDIPSYSADYLAELKSSQLKAPPDSTHHIDEDEQSEHHRELDIAAKFGSSSTTLVRSSDTSTRILTEAEIEERKARRQRLKHEQDFISLNDDGIGGIDNDDDELQDPRQRALIIQADEDDRRNKYGETRLEHEDEDMAEGFDDFVEDAGRVTLGRRAARDQERQRRRDIEAQIQEAERGMGKVMMTTAGQQGLDSDDDEIDQDEMARMAAYEASQTKAGTYGSRNAKEAEKDRERRLRQRLENIPKPQPLPQLSATVAKFQQAAIEAEQELERGKQRAIRLAQEKEEIEKEEIRLHALLKEAGERFEKLKAEAGAPATKEHIENVEKGLESLEKTIPPEGEATAHETQLELDQDVADTYSAPEDNGMPFQRSFGGMAAMPNDDEDNYY